MPTTDDTHHYFHVRVEGHDVVVIVPSELQPFIIDKIEEYFTEVIERLRKGYV